MEKAPATSPASPVSTTACEDTPPPPTPAIREALVTNPSTAPNTVGRSHPPETSRCRCAQPAAKAGFPVRCAGPGSPSRTTWTSCPDRPLSAPHHLAGDDLGRGLRVVTQNPVTRRRQAVDRAGRRGRRSGPTGCVLAPARAAFGRG